MGNESPVQAARAEVEAIDRKVAAREFGRARPWGGADVGISSTPPEPHGSGFYPEPRYVVTVHAAELSWLFEQLWQSDSAIRNIAGSNKEEFFGRLANAANRYLKRTNRETAHDLLGAVVHELYAWIEEVEDGGFPVLLVAPGGMVYDDLIDGAEREGYMTVEETRRWFAERGVE